ncbi:MAG: sulfotransferase, partial [Caulobacteraceae bacterium]|nr:sulfotransferase [Caulobacteraceae bacterium]
TLMNLGMGAEALPHLEFAAKALPDRPDILFNLAVILNSLGHLDEAEGVLEKLIKGAPGYLPAYEFLGELRTARPDANQVDRLRAVRARVVGPDAAYIDYALFKQLDDLDRRDEAWRALTRASEAKLGQQRWTAAADEDLAAAFRGVAATLPARAAPTGGSPRSIFIVSLPRTGSTLTERIFSAHPKVRALGELEAFGRLAKQAAGLGLLPYVDRRLGDAGALDWAAVGAAYRAEVGGLAPGAEVVTDKMPLNWWYAPFIAAALPDASIVHIRRQPMDALFGAYKMSFTNAFGWSYRFEDMAAHYGVYRRLTEHWSRLMGDRLIQLDYEALVTDPEPVTRRLLDACGLEFDPACLKPHLSKGSVSTPSAAQVREPVTSAKIGSWRRYAEQLEPLRALLQRDGWVDANGDGVAA